MRVSVQFELDIEPAEWVGRLRGVPVPVDETNQALAERITAEVRAHVEDVIRSLYFDQGWIN